MKKTCGGVKLHDAISNLLIDIPRAYVEGMSQLCDLHSKTGVGETGEYLPATDDRQVGLGVLGLANLLRRYGVSYEQFGRALDQYHAGETKATAAFELVLPGT